MAEKLHQSGAVVSTEAPEDFPKRQDAASILIVTTPATGKMYALVEGRRGLPDLYYSFDSNNMQVPAGSVPAGVGYTRFTRNNAMSAFWDFISSTYNRHPDELFGEDWEQPRKPDSSFEPQINSAKPPVGPMDLDDTSPLGPDDNPDVQVSVKDPAKPSIQTPDPDADENLTPAQKAARTRAENRAAEEREKPLGDDDPKPDVTES